MLEKYRNILLLLIILAGFALRFYAATSVPINHDECFVDFPSAREISFDLKNLNLPLTDKKDPSFPDSGPMASKYFIRLGWHIFGDSLLGARLPFVIIGTVTILLVYLLAKSALGTEIALLSSFLLSISQYDIGMTRLAENDALLVFFSSLSLLLFYKALKASSKKLVLVNGLVIGAGFWSKESMLFLIPVYSTFLLVCREYRQWLKNRYLWISFVIAFWVMLPSICSNSSPDATRFKYILKEADIRVSINAISFYLGELILLIAKPFPEFFVCISGNVDSEYPIVNFVLGILILIAVVKSIRNKTPFLRLLVVYFLFNFTVFSFISYVNPEYDQCYWSLEAPDWNILGFVPGVILTANMLREFIKRHKYPGHFILGTLIIYMLIGAWDITTYPLNCFSPTKDYSIGKWLNAGEDSWPLKDGGFWKTKNAVKDMLERIYKVTNEKPIYKKRAALRLVEILLQEGRYKESEKYLLYVLSQDPDDKRACELLDRLKMAGDLEK